MLFGQYVPPRVVRTLAENPAVATMSGESREMSVLFSDVRDFTSISENLPTDQLATLMNDYLSAMTRSIQDQNGTIDKYIGDAIMGFWGASIPRPDHELGTVRAALAMQETAAERRKVYAERNWPPLHVGIGINSGTMSVGNMGSEFRRAYTVLGDAVNLASRLEGLTKHYGVGILVNESTAAETRDLILYREIDRIQVKGREEPVRIFEPLAECHESGNDLAPNVRALAESYAKMLAGYRAQEWDEAEAMLYTLERAGESPVLTGLFRQRIGQMRGESPIQDWDGVFRFREK